MRKILEQCPTCESKKLIVSEVTCGSCGTMVRSRYRPTIFAQLSTDDVRFVEIFVKNRGNVKEMERELGVSYWTIRSRLDQVIEQLGFGDANGNTAAEDGLRARRRDILARVESGEIDAVAAARALAQLDDKKTASKE